MDTILKRRNTLAFDATVKGKFKLTVKERCKKKKEKKTNKC